MPMFASLFSGGNNNKSDKRWSSQLRASRCNWKRKIASNYWIAVSICSFRVRGSTTCRPKYKLPDFVFPPAGLKNRFSYSIRIKRCQVEASNWNEGLLNWIIKRNPFSSFSIPRSKTGWIKKLWLSSGSAEAPRNGSFTVFRLHLESDGVSAVARGLRNTTN